MERFLQRHRQSVTGTLSGFDRVRFRGTLRLLSYVSGMMCFLKRQGVLLKQFKEYARALTARVRESSAALAEQRGRPVLYLASSTASKEDHARRIAAADGVQEGLICVLTCVEPCRTYDILRNAQSQRLELRSTVGRCLHHYFYFQHPRLGFLHVRLQTWFPFTMHVCLNGREWLARQLDGAGLGYVRKDNCFVSLDDAAGAQRLCDEQLTTAWPALLDGLMQQVHPTHAAILGDYPDRYYWSADQVEWATDVLFRSPQALAAYYPRWLRHGVADMHRRAEISQAANERYLDALATVDQTTPLATWMQPLCQPTTLNGRRVRALNPLAPDDAALLEAVNHGEFLLTGFRNRDLVRLLYPHANASDPTEVRRRSAAVTRKLRLLRAHGLIQKIPHTHRYQLTKHGRDLITIILAARQANTTKLLAAA